MNFKKVLTLTLIVFLVTTGFTMVFSEVEGIDNEKINEDEQTARESQPVPMADYTFHDPIRIDNDTELANKADYGDGTETNPYVIEGYEIDGDPEGYCIYVGNTTAHFVVRNCYLHHASSNFQKPYINACGLHLHNTQNGTLENNTSTSNFRHGLMIMNSGNNTISNNTLESNNHHGILLRDSDYNTFHNNTMLDGGLFMSGRPLSYWNTHTIDKSNKVNGKPVYYWKNQTNGTVPSGAGKVILANCTGVTVEDQNVSGGSIGINIAFSHNNTIKKNIAYSADRYGIYIYRSKNNTIKKNTVEKDFTGIIVDKSDNNKFIQNTVSYNYADGIFFHASQRNIIDNNTFSSNDQSGIYIHSANDNTITNNTISFNDDYDIFLYKGCQDNTFYHNNIIDNWALASDDGNNKWNASYPVGGNYWSGYGGEDNYSGPNQSQPGSDGIGDKNKSIPGGVDEYPLMNPAGSPYVSSTEPAENSVDVSTGKNVTIIFSESLNTSVVPDLNQTGGPEVNYSFAGWNSTTMENDTAIWTHSQGWGAMNNITLKVSGYEDTYGNEGANHSWSFYTEDTTQPDSSVETIRPYWRNDTISVTASATDVDSGVKNVTLYYRYSADNSTWNNWTEFATDSSSPWNWSLDFPEGDGHYQFYSIATDEKNNTEGDKSSAEAICGFDTTSPAVGISSPSEGANISSSDVTVQWSGSDSRSGIDYYEVQLNSGGWTDVGTSNSHTFTNLSEGLHTVDIEAIDNAGNNAVDTVNFTIDTTPPKVSIESPTDGTIFSKRDVTTQWSGEDTETGVDHYEIQLDGDGWTEVGTSTSHTFSGLSDGTHTVEVRAVDITRNSETDVTNFTVDATSPSVSISSPSEGTLFNSTDTTIEWSGSDSTTGIDRYEVKIDGGSWKEVGKNTSDELLDLGDGEHTMKVRAYDGAGNTAEDNITFMVDSTGPSISITSPSDGANISETNVTIEWSGSDDETSIVQYNIRLDDGSWKKIGTNTTFTFEDLSEDSHIVEVKAVDEAGNTVTKTIQFSVTGEGDSGTQDTEPGEEIGGIPWWIIPLIAAVIVLALVALFMKRKKGKEEESSIEEEEKKDEELVKKKRTKKRDDLPTMRKKS